MIRAFLPVGYWPSMWFIVQFGWGSYVDFYSWFAGFCSQPR